MLNNVSKMIKLQRFRNHEKIWQNSFDKIFRVLKSNFLEIVSFYVISILLSQSYSKTNLIVYVACMCMLLLVMFDWLLMQLLRDLFSTHSKQLFKMPYKSFRYIGIQIIPALNLPKTVPLQFRLEVMCVSQKVFKNTYKILFYSRMGPVFNLTLSKDNFTTLVIDKNMNTFGLETLCMKDDNAYY